MPHFCLLTEWCEGGVRYLRRVVDHHSINVTRRVMSHIALDAAKACEYLHSLQPPIIHGNIKAEKLLITEDLQGQNQSVSCLNCLRCRVIRVALVKCDFCWQSFKPPFFRTFRPSFLRTFFPKFFPSKLPSFLPFFLLSCQILTVCPRCAMYTYSSMPASWQSAVRNIHIHVCVHT